MAEPFEEFAAERWDRTQPGGLDLAQELRSIQVDQLDKIEPGAIAAAVLGFATNPTAGDTVVIGADTYEFRAAAADLSDDTFIAVEIGVDATTTLANLVNAINAKDGDNAHPTIFQTDSTTPALANGTENVVGESISAGIALLIKGAASPGGAAQVGNPSIVLGETLTAPGDFWKEGNVNLNTLGGRAAAGQQSACLDKAITAAMITAGEAHFVFPFTVARFIIQCRSAGGLIRLFQNDTADIDGNGNVLVALAGGGAPDIQATDVVTVHAWA